MKTKKLCLLLLSGMLLLTGCGETTSTDDGSTSQTSYDFDYDLTTISEAIEIAKQNTSPTETRYYIYGTISEIANYSYGQMTIQDETGSIEAYGTYSADGTKRYSELENKPQVGDMVVLYSNLSTYKDTPQIYSGWIVWQKEGEKDFDESKYEVKTIAEAREMSADSLVKVSGVVTRKTYANGMVDSGFYLVDNTSSIYIHSSAAASQVSEGNKITLCGSVDFWILDSEKTNAEKLGYKGSCQLSDVTITENDKLTTNSYDKSWISESTVKEIMETEVTENITNKIYKVNSLVKKAAGTGFTNYYFDDIDGVTGSYAYTQCNGSDFAWLDAFDGKICTVYLTAINAKCNASGAIWRFMPIEVIDEDYKFDTKDVNEYVWTYHLEDLFLDNYTGDPILEVPTTVSSELLGFTDASIAYASSNEEVATFEVEDGKTIFHVKGVEGSSTITININYGTNDTLTKTLTVSYTKASYGETKTVKEAIDAENGVEITVKGIAGPSLTNQTGFYLIDDTGVIAVKTSTDDMANIALGNEVVFKGTKTKGYGLKSGSTSAGQSCLLDSTLVVNLYGQHDYSRTSFILGKTLADVYGLDATVDHSTEVYTVTAKVLRTDYEKYSTIVLTDGDTKLTLYCSSANQYNWLSNAFDADKELTIDVAPVNWNSKKFWVGCVLSATDGVTRVNNTLNYAS